jgi:hypothetical protein
MSKLADCRRCDELEAVPGKGMRCRRGGGFIEPEDLGPLSDFETEGRLCAFDGPFGAAAQEEQPQTREDDPMPKRTILDEVCEGKTIRDLIREAYEGPKDSTQVARELCELTGLVVTAQQVASSWGHMGPRQPRKPRAKRTPAAEIPVVRADGLPAAAPLPPREGFVLSSLVAAFVAHKGLDPAEWQAFRAGWEAALEVTA